MSENFYTCPKCHKTALVVFFDEKINKEKVFCNDCGWKGKIDELEIKNGAGRDERISSTQAGGR